MAHLTIIGTGNMGQAIAAVAGKGGHTVQLLGENDTTPPSPATSSSSQSPTPPSPTSSPSAARAWPGRSSSTSPTR